MTFIQFWILKKPYPNRATPLHFVIIFAYLFFWQNFGNYLPPPSKRKAKELFYGQPSLSCYNENDNLTRLRDTVIKEIQALSPWWVSLNRNTNSKQCKSISIFKCLLNSLLMGHKRGHSFKPIWSWKAFYGNGAEFRKGLSGLVFPQTKW